MASRKKQFRKFTATALTATFVASAIAPIAFADSSKFTDVTENYKAGVDLLLAKGAQGLTETEFGVHKSISRLDAAVLLAKVLELDEDSAAPSGFTDVPQEAAKAVNALKAAGITNGKTAVLFGSSDEITRGELAIWIQKGFGLEATSTEIPFTDVSATYKEAVTALVDHKIASGLEAAKFGINEVVTRGDFANFMKNASEKPVNVEDVWELQISANVESTVADGESEIPVKIQLVNKTTKELAENAEAITVELTTSFGEITSEKVTITNGEAQATLKTEASYQAVNAKIDVKITEAPEEYKDLIGKITGTAAIELKGKESGENFLLSVMHTNDTHSHVEAAPKMVTAVKEVRASKPNALLVDAGDPLTGTLYFNEFSGQAELLFFNLMKYDMMTLGNHEFDLGSTPDGHKALAAFIKGAQFPIISANVDASKDANLKDLFTGTIAEEPENGKVFDGIIKTINGEKVGFFGLTTEETSTISSPVEVTFTNYIDEAKTAVAAFEKLGINKIVAVTHLGYDDNPEIDNDRILAAEVAGIDLIVGGHSHTELGKPIIIETDSKGIAKDPTVIVQAYQYNEYLGTVDVEFDKDGKVVGHAGKLIKVAEKEADKEASELLQTFSTKVDEVKNAETGGTAAIMLSNPRSDDGGSSVRKNETELGNLITDAMLEKAKEYNSDTVIAMQNGGGIRAEIAEGPITLGQILTTLPYGNTLATMKLKGSEILLALEHSVRSYPRESGGFLHVSGMKFTFDSSKPAGSRVQTVEVKAADGTYTPLNKDTDYVIATNAFTAKGGDGFDVFKKAYEEGRVTDLGLADWENLRDYVSKLKTVNPEVEGRIVHVEK